MVSPVFQESLPNSGRVLGRPGAKKLQCLSDSTLYGNGRAFQGPSPTNGIVVRCDCWLSTLTTVTTTKLTNSITSWVSKLIDQANSCKLAADDVEFMVVHWRLSFLKLVIPPAWSESNGSGSTQSCLLSLLKRFRFFFLSNHWSGDFFGSSSPSYIEPRYLQANRTRCIYKNLTWCPLFFKGPSIWHERLHRTVISLDETRGRIWLYYTPLQSREFVLRWSTMCVFKFRDCQSITI